MSSNRVCKSCLKNTFCSPTRLMYFLFLFFFFLNFDFIPDFESISLINLLCKKFLHYNYSVLPKEARGAVASPSFNF